MGYESKIYFCIEYDFPEGEIHYSSIVAMIDMHKMGYSKQVNDFLNCFDTETSFSISIEGYDDENEVECMVDEIKDKYGERLKYASNTERLYKCAKEMEKSDDYWRFEILRKMIKEFKKYPYVKIVHYGY